jgi:hypothetical protein
LAVKAALVKIMVLPILVMAVMAVQALELVVVGLAELVVLELLFLDTHLLLHLPLELVLREAPLLLRVKK